jgi:hypothetical protein
MRSWPITAALLRWLVEQGIVNTSGHLPSLVALIGSGELNLNSVDAVDAVNEEDENEDECDLNPCQ